MGYILALCGPSGSGKTSLRMAIENAGILALTSHTTRAPRAGEMHGKDYYFVTNEVFDKIDFIETTGYDENKYGLSTKEVEDHIKLMPISSVVVDINGVKQLKNRYDDKVIFVFIMVTPEEAISRMKNRGDSISSINSRIQYSFSTHEFDNWKTADWILRNKNFDVAKNQLTHILRQYLPFLCLVA